MLLVFEKIFNCDKTETVPRYYTGSRNSPNATPSTKHLQLPLLLTPPGRGGNPRRKDIPSSRQERTEAERDFPKPTPGHGRGHQAEAWKHHTKETSGVRQSQTHLRVDGLGMPKDSIGEVQQLRRKYTSDRGVARKHCGQTPFTQTE